MSHKVASRKLAYIWVTWLTGLLSGERQCWGAAWYRAHNRNYRKRPGSTGLSEWIREHDEMVSEAAAAERAAGFQIRVEDDNKMTVKGEVAIVGAKPDLIRFNDETATVIDLKTGRRRDSDRWQVLAYMLLAPTVLDHVGARKIAGELRYRDGKPPVALTDADFSDDAKGAIVEAIKRVGQHDALPMAPSEKECRYCDIADCKERVGMPIEGQTKAF